MASGTKLLMKEVASGLALYAVTCRIEQTIKRLCRKVLNNWFFEKQNIFSARVSVPPANVNVSLECVINGAILPESQHATAILAKLVFDFLHLIILKL